MDKKTHRDIPNTAAALGRPYYEPHGFTQEMLMFYRARVVIQTAPTRFESVEVIYCDSTPVVEFARVIAAVADEAEGVIHRIEIGRDPISVQ